MLGVCLLGKRLLQGLTLPLGVVLLWWAATEAALVNTTILPGPGEVFLAVADLVGDGRLWGHLDISLRRVIGGFALALLFGLPAGLAVGYCSRVREFLAPFLHFLRQIPPIAWIPVFILWLGIDEMSKLAVIAYAAFFPVFLNTAAGVGSISQGYLQMGRMLDFKWVESFRHIIWPAALPSIVAGLRLGMGNSWRALVVAEMIAASNGLGFLIVDSRQRVDTPEMYAGILVIGTVGLILDYLLVGVEARLLVWQDR
jgi:sulfonate transport system permease protein